jgi:hypothetical protein
MTLSKCANSLGLQVQSDVARENFPTKVTRGWGTFEKDPVLVKQPAKQVLCLVSPTPPSGCQAQSFEISIANKTK